VKLRPATSRLWFFWGLTLMAMVILLDVGLRFWHPPTGTDLLGRFGWVMVAASVVVVWLIYLGHIGALSRLNGQVEAKTLEFLSSAAELFVFFNYITILIMLRFGH
jgi:hypothetical protein